MRKLILLLLLCTPLWGQMLVQSDPIKGSLTTTAAAAANCTATSCLPVATVGFSVLSITVHGTFAGVTIVFEGSDDGGLNWYPSACARADAAIQENSEAIADSTNRSWDCGVYGFTQFQIRQSARGSGATQLGLTLSTNNVEPAENVALTVGSTVGITTTTPADATSNTSVPGPQSFNMLFNGTTWDRWRAGGLTGAGSMVISPSGISVDGITPITSPSVESNRVLKASAGNFYGACTTTGATAGFMMVFNATAAPADGAVTPVEWLQIAANSTGCLSYGSGPPNAYATGITVVFSSTGPFTKTASATAAFVGRIK